jgi:hypothetical protein
MELLALGVLTAGAVVFGVAGFAPFLGSLSARAAGLCEGYRYWLRAGALGWLVGQVPLAATVALAVGARLALAAPTVDADIIVAASLLTVMPSVAVGVFLAAVLALRAGRYAELPASGELRLRERYASGELTIIDFEERVGRALYHRLRAG